MTEWLSLMSDPAAWVALLTLIAMEVVLGIDNLIFISILTNKLPEGQRAKARRLGIGGALILRLLLLGTVAFIVTLTTPVFTLFGQGFSWRDIILIGGGLFLVFKATMELESDDGGTVTALLDLVFSIDSIITAVGMTSHVPIMVIAVLVAVAVMLLAATPLANFIQANPTVVMLALGFLLLIGTMLIAEGFGAQVPKGYVYGAMAFSALVESLNILARRNRQKRSSG